MKGRPPPKSDAPRGRKPAAPGKSTGGKPAGSKSGFGKAADGKPGGGARSFAKPSGAPGRARGGAKAATARKGEGGKPAFKAPFKSGPKPAAKPAPKAAVAKVAIVPSTPAKPSVAKGVSLDVRQYRVQPDDDGIRLDRWFQRHLPDVGFNIVSRWSRTGQLRIDGARAAPGDRVAEGQMIRVPPAEAKAPAAERPKRARVIDLTEDEIAFVQEMVIHRDAQAIVINKPPGLSTQGGTRTDEHVDKLLDGLMFDSESRPKLVHRLDKDTSGALLIARTSRAAAHFAKALSSRTARKV